MRKNDIPQENLPYLVVGHTSVGIPRLSILLTAEGIKELAKRTKLGDMVRIEQWSDYTNECEKVRHYSRISIVEKTK